MKSNSRRGVRLGDLCQYPVVNSPNSFPDPALTAVLEKCGVFKTGPPRVEAYFASTIRRYVELGFGIGLIPGLPGRRPGGPFHERSLSRWFGQARICLVWRKGSLVSEAARAFAEAVRTLMSSGR